MIRLPFSIVKPAVATPHVLRHSEGTKFLQTHELLSEPVFGSGTSSVRTTQLYLYAGVTLQATALTKVSLSVKKRA
jgi:site-specific recombinase XerC